MKIKTTPKLTIRVAYSPPRVKILVDGNVASFSMSCSMGKVVLLAKLCIFSIFRARLLALNIVIINTVEIFNHFEDRRFVGFLMSM